MKQLLRIFSFILCLTILVVCAKAIQAQDSRQTFTTAKNLSSFVRVKGQEENFLQGIGLVVGLKGTGDTDLTPTHRALSLILKHSGNNSGSGPEGEYAQAEIENVKNVALVMVRAKVGSEGAEEGDFLDCEVTAFGAKSLEGGSLAISTLQGPNPHDKTVWAIASGRIDLASTELPTRGTIEKGCRIEKTIRNQYITEDNKLYLIVKDEYKDWQMVYEIASEINDYRANPVAASGTQIARAIDQKTIEVSIPDQYKEFPADFIALLMGTVIYDKQTNNKVVINRQKGLIVIGTEVEIGPCVVNHKGINIEAGNSGASRFVEVGTRLEYANQLKELTQALDALKVPAEDVIDIIIAIHHQGKLYGELVFID